MADGASPSGPRTDADAQHSDDDGLARRALGQLPTTRADWTHTARTVAVVLRTPRYAVVALLMSAIALLLLSISLNLQAIQDVVLSGSLPVGNRLRFLAEQLPLVGTTFGPPESAVLLVVAGLTGVNVAVAVAYLAAGEFRLRRSGPGVLGVVLGTLGAGCGACGSAVLLGVLSLVGVQASLLWLPLEGLEFALVGAAVLVLSTYWLAEGLRGVQVPGCPVAL